MEMKSVRSSAISAVGYDPETEQMDVQFVGNGRVFSHEGVPSSLYEAFINSDSLGAFYANQIKGQY